MFKIRKDYLGIILSEMAMAEPWWGLGGKTPETFQYFFIWRTNKKLKIKETLQANFF